jgi:hypothetical protein
VVLARMILDRFLTRSRFCVAGRSDSLAPTDIAEGDPVEAAAFRPPKQSSPGVGL